MNFKNEFLLSQDAFLIIDYSQKLMYNMVKAKKLTLKGIIKMDDNRLVEFILNLTEEEVDKIIAVLPKLTAMLEESVQPSRPEPSAPIQ